MSIIEALILGIVQGLTEFLPISSSGHLEIGNVLLNIQDTDHLSFTIIVHAATVCSILVVFRRDILHLIRGVSHFRWNPSTRYLFFILLSMIPVGLVGLFFKEEVEAIFSGNLILVGSMLIITGLLLLFTHFKKPQQKEVGFIHSFIIGIAQAFAVLPGISRSGATIATGLLVGIEKEKATRFSFLMVLLPIIGITLLQVVELSQQPAPTIKAIPLIVGFVAAFVSGYFACRWMLRIVRQMQLYYFSLYCFFIGGIAIFANIL